MDNENSRGGKIYELLPKVMDDIGAVGRDRENKHQRYRFRGIDDALNAVHPSLVKHGVAMSVEVSDHRLEPVITVPPAQNGFADPKQCMIRATLSMRLTFYGPDGSSISNVTAGEALDYNGDKATNKAMSAAAKYAFFLGLCIPVEENALEDSDHDNRAPENHGGSNGNGNGHAAQRPPQTAQQSSVAAQPRANGQHPNGQSPQKSAQELAAENQIAEAATPERVGEIREKLADPRRQLPQAVQERLVGLCWQRVEQLNAAAAANAAIAPPGF